MDPLSTARGGLMAASARFEASAERTARMGADASVDPAQEAVEQITAKHQFSANLGVIRIADEMWKSLLAIQER
jgi:flagellar hook protein FlgE